MHKKNTSTCQETQSKHVENPENSFSQCPKIAPKDQEIVLFIELSDVLPKIITAYEILNGGRLGEKMISKLTTVTFLDISGKDALALFKKMKAIIAKSQNIMRLQNLFIWDWKHIASWLKDFRKVSIND